MAVGKVLWFNKKKGYGFIKADNEPKEIFVHFTAIDSQKKYRTLYVNDVVSFDIEDGKKGPQAACVVVTQRAPRKPTKKNSQNFARKKKPMVIK